MSLTNLVKKRKKQGYLLLELLIGIALITLFLTPMLKGPFDSIRKQKRDIASLRIGLESDKILISVEEDLRTGSIPWEALVQSQTNPISLEKYSSSRSLGDSLPSIQSRVFLTKSRMKKLENGVWIGMVTVKVEFLFPPCLIGKEADKKDQKYEQSSTFFVARKKWEKTALPPLSEARNPICRGS